MKPIITTNPHDAGFDLVEGEYVTGPVVGRIYWDDSDSDNPGLVLDVHDHESVPDTIEEVRAHLAEHGYELTAESVADVISLTNDA